LAKELVKAPAPPQLYSRVWERRQRRRRRRRIVALSLASAFLLLSVCGVSGVFVYRSGITGPKTPEAAAGALLGSMQRDSINEFEQTLCESKRYQAGSILRDFNSGMVQSGESLSQIKWTVTKQTNQNKSTVLLDLNVTFVVVEKRTKGRADKPFPMRMQAISDRGWYICEIQILAL
jgi:hypothetical protein